MATASVMAAVRGRHEKATASVMAAVTAWIVVAWALPMVEVAAPAATPRGLTQYLRRRLLRPLALARGELLLWPGRSQRPQAASHYHVVLKPNEADSNVVAARRRAYRSPPSLRRPARPHTQSLPAIPNPLATLGRMQVRVPSCHHHHSKRESAKATSVKAVVGKGQSGAMLADKGV